jgi:hypothetical protein
MEKSETVGEFEVRKNREKWRMGSDRGIGWDKIVRKEQLKLVC